MVYLVIVISNYTADWGRCKIERSMEQRLRFYALKTENGLRRVRNPWYN